MKKFPGEIQAMKITLNLANPPNLHERYGLKLAVPAFFGGVLLAGLLGPYLARDYREYAELRRDVRRLETRRAELAERTRDLQASLRQPRAQGTLREVEFVNALINRKRLSLSDLTMKLAALLPPEVRLSNLIMLRAGNDSDLRFQLSGKSEEALEAFMKNLHDSPDFADPTFTSEGSEQEGPGAGTITIVCQTHYIGLRAGNAETVSGRR